jgi:outer membrane protein TolC
MRRCLLTAGAVCLLSFFGAFVFVHAAQEPAESSDSLLAQVKSLRKERVETLEQLVPICLAQYQQGAIGFDSWAAAQDELIDAQLQLAEKPGERTAIWKKRLENASAVLKLADERYKSGHTTNADVYRAKAHYLNVKIKSLCDRSKR